MPDELVVVVVVVVVSILYSCCHNRSNISGVSIRIRVAF